MPQAGRRALAPWEIAARRRNAQKSTGPRTLAGKRRSALNALQRDLCESWREARIRIEGDAPADFRRLHRDVLAFFPPGEPFYPPVVEDLAGAWRKKARRLSVLPPPRGFDAALEIIHREIEERLEDFVDSLSLRSRKWFCRLCKALGAVPDSPTDLRIRMEAHMATFKALRRRAAVSAKQEKIRDSLCETKPSSS